MAHRYVTGLAVALVSFELTAAPVHVTGMLAAPGSRVVVDATVTISAGSTVLRKDEPILNSRIDFSFDTDRSSLTLDISATGYQPRRVNVEIEHGVAAIGAIALQPIPGVALGKIVYYHPPGTQRELLDFVVRNEDRANYAQIVAVEVNGTRRSKTECFDTATPAIEFDIANGRQFGKTKDAEMSLVVRVKDSHTNTLAAQGRVEFLPCEQIRLHTRIDYAMRLSPGEEQKIRLELPAISRSGVPKILGLDAWAQLQLSVTLADGRAFATRELQNPRKP